MADMLASTGSWAGGSGSGWCLWRWRDGRLGEDEADGRESRDAVEMD